VTAGPDQRSVAVSGGSRGIGAAIAASFLEEGAIVTVLDIELYDTLPAGARFVRTDISDPGVVD
jgi:NAD(P)-dependent dehydrogenase (short-subunit alcohol dehydrogenase family)